MLEIGQIHRIEYELANDRADIVAFAEAPGRIHFLGDQGDTSSCFFLSATIDRYVYLAVSHRKDSAVRFFAANIKERKRGTLANLKFRREDRWANYIKAAIFLYTELGCPMKGLNFTFCGDIPQQIGLASSTAIEAAAAAALRSLLRVQINDEELAKRLHAAHEKFFGKSASLADYLVCFSGRGKNHFLLVDTSAQEIIKIKSPFTRFRFLLVDSHIPQFGVESELALRKADAVKGLEFLSKKNGGLSVKDLGSADLLEAVGNFPEQVRRRTIHIVEEIHRVQDAHEALERKDLASFAKIIYHSHESLRDLYEVSCPEIDWLVKRAQELEGAAGSRMTGIGFGGCTYTIIRCELVEEFKRRLEEYEKIFGFRPVIYEVKIAAGVKLLPAEKMLPKKKRIAASRRVYANTAHK